MRPDNPHAVMMHKDRFYGGKALVVLGGPSGKDWEKLKEEINPDVVLTANAVRIPCDYWMLAENMNYQEIMSRTGETEEIRQRGKGFMQMLTTPVETDVKMICYLSWELCNSLGIDMENAISIRRLGDALIGTKELPDDFSLREYGDGFMNGPIFSREECVKPSVKYHVGTVAAHLIHLSGIIGCVEVHTIGMDFRFRKKHHWYIYPPYQEDRFRTKLMFTDYHGVPTSWEWIEGAEWFKSIEWIFDRDGLEWTDHSNGLLKEMELNCAR